MSKFTVCVSLGDFVKYTIGEIYYLAPNHKPRFIIEIIDEIEEKFKEGYEPLGKDFFYHNVELKDLKQFISDILMPIDRFRELNLSQREYDAGVKVEDEDRPKFVFNDLYTHIPEYDSFIDLEACIQNIFCKFEHKEFEHWRNGEIEVEELMRFRKEYQADDINIGE